MSTNRFSDAKMNPRIIFKPKIPSPKAKIASDS